MFEQLAASGVLVDGFSSVLSWLLIALLVFKIFALVDVLFRRSDAFPAVEKQTKAFWVIILAVVVAVSFVPIGGLILNLVGLVAAIVYVVDVRPRVRAIAPSRRSRFKLKKGDRDNSGPYGPW